MMISHHSWQWFVISIILLKPAYSFCPSKCICTGDLNSRTSCVEAELEFVPIQLNPDTKYINLTLNKIRNVDFTLPFYTQLEVLDLSQNIIESLGSKNFELQNQLHTLNLSWNSVTSLQKDAFKGLTSLLVLNLSYNRIEIVHALAMNDLTSLILLDLTNNNILSLDESVFRNMISMENLIFKNNQLVDVPANNLRYLNSLKSLDLSINLIKFVKNESFSELKDLIVLSLSGNVISELDVNCFDGLVSLKHLDIADTNLTHVPTKQLSKLSNLTYLSLSGNRFSYIPAVAFLNLFHLRELQLNRLDWLSRIDSRAFVDNTHLQIIHLNNNTLFADLPRRLFHGNPNLQEISIQGNNLQTIDAAQFPIDKLKKLYIGDNPLQCNCSLLWLWRLVSGNIDVSANSLTIHRNTSIESDYLLILDSDKIGCDTWADSVRTRRIIRSMSETDIICPAHVIAIVCAVLTGLVIVMTGASVIFYIRYVKKRRKLIQDRQAIKNIVNVQDRILQQQPSDFQQQPTQVDKLELERYLAAQAIANEYRALTTWDLPKNETSQEPEHLYEKFDHYEYPDTSTLHKSHVVYV